MNKTAVTDEESGSRAMQLTPMQIKAYTEPTDRFGQPLKTARAGQTEYNNGSILVKSTDPLDQCVVRGILDECHRKTGRDMRTIRDKANSKLNGLIYTGGGSDIASAVDAETLNKHIRLLMTKRNWQRISIVVFATPDIDGRYNFSEEDYSMMMRFAPELQYAFEALQDCMIQAHKTISDRIKKMEEEKNANVQ